MALLFTDSFDHYSNPTLKGWAVTNGVAIDGSSARTGVGGAHFPAATTGTLSRSLPSTPSALFVGFALQIPGSGSTFIASPFFTVTGSSPSNQLQLRVVPAGAGLFNIEAFVIYGGGASSASLGTSSPTIQQGTWYYIEVALEASSNYFEVMVNGASWISGTNSNLGVTGAARLEWTGPLQAGSSGSISVIQSTGNTSYTTGTSHSQAFTSNVTDGSTLAVLGWVNNGQSSSYPPTISDSQSNDGWIRVALQNSNFGTTQLYAFICPGAKPGPTTVTVEYAGGSFAGLINAVGEIAGADHLDQVNSGGGAGSGGTYTSPSITTTAAAEIIIANFQPAGDSAGVTVVPPLSLLGHAPGSTSYGIAGYNVVGSTGTYYGQITGVGVTTGLGSIIFSLNEASSEMYLDDVYVCDSLTPQNNFFLGPISIQCVLPTGPGNVTAWTPGGSSSTGVNWSNVNENPPDGLVTYVSTAADDTTDFYAFAPVTSNGILGVAVNICAMNNAPSPRRLVRAVDNTPDTVLQDSGTDLEPPETPTFGVVQGFFPTRPAIDGGGEWTAATLNAAQFGVRLTG